MRTSKNDLYFIEKHRYYELKHFCLQYSKWKAAYEKLNHKGESKCSDDDPTSRIGIQKADYARCIDLVERASRDADPGLSEAILKAVTGAPSLDNKVDMVSFYAAYRRFYWLLDRYKGL